MNTKEILRNFLYEGKSDLEILGEFNLKEGELKDLLFKFKLTTDHQGILAKLEDDALFLELTLNKIVAEKKSIISEYNALKFFLVYGLSKRGICRVVNGLTDLSGKKAQTITNRYGLLNIHRGILFLHTEKDSKAIIIKIMKEGGIDNQPLALNLARFTKKYSGIIIQRQTVTDNFNVVLNGELRNLIQSVFKTLKKDLGTCQFKGCNEKHLQASHAKEKERTRPDLLLKAINEHTAYTNNPLSIDVEAVLNLFLQYHRNCEENAVGVKKYPPVLFLCEDHHREYEVLFDVANKIKEKRVYNDFISNIIF